MWFLAAPQDFRQTQIKGNLIKIIHNELYQKNITSHSKKKKLFDHATSVPLCWIRLNKIGGDIRFLVAIINTFSQQVPTVSPVLHTMLPYDLPYIYLQIIRWIRVIVKFNQFRECYFIPYKWWKLLYLEYNIVLLCSI